MVAASSASAAAPTVTKVTVSGVTSTSAVLKAEIDPQGEATSFHFEYGTADCFDLPNSCTAIPVPDEAIGSGTSPVPVAVPLTGLSQATVYHFVIEAANASKTRSADRVFATYSDPFVGLPDNRAYEQSSPVDKDGGDAQGQQSLVKATPTGDGITFGSTFGMPDGKGAQALPTFVAKRGGGQWSTEGLLPPIGVGQRARVIGWLPDYSEVFTLATQLGDPRTEGLVGQSGNEEPVEIAPYRSKAEWAYVGSSQDGSTVLFEGRAALPAKAGGPLLPGTVQGGSNLYAWDRATKEVHLAGVTNDEKSPGPRGSFAGPYDWVFGSTGRPLQEGGAARNYYLQDTHAFAPDGDIYFTAAGTGQLYLRLNPTRPQSAMAGEQCLKPNDACTIQASASERTVPDPAGQQPATFQAASADGSEVFFTSSQKLTDDANTGPEQPKAQISRDTIDGNPDNIQPAFVPERAVGIATDSEHIYWADPVGARIGRADLNGDNKDPNFIGVPEGQCEREFAPGEFEPVDVPASPRYLAVDAGYIYWTNTGRRSELGIPLDGGGTIGRAKLGATEAEEVDPDFICGEDPAQPGEKLVSNPQGIAVNATDIYWADAAAQDPLNRWIARAAIDGTAVEGQFFDTPFSRVPYGLELNGTHLYFVINDELNNLGSIRRITLDGEEEKFLFIGEAGLRGVALDASHVYWVSQNEEAIGRADLELENKDNDFIETEGTVNGLAATATHLLWSVNGEAPSNPGNDLYRFRAGASEPLEDLTPDSADANGAEVQGVLGASADGSHVYFAANGDLDGPGGEAVKGNCKGTVQAASGKCSLYLWQEGASIRFVAPFSASNGGSLNWVGTPVEALNSGSYAPRTSFLGEDGETLLFRSQEKLTDYDNEGVPELYLYRAGDDSIRCVGCPPTGEAAGAGPSLGSTVFPVLQPPPYLNSLFSRNLSADGNRVFFETAEALVAADVNGQGGCPPSGTAGFPACLDVYEWEAPNTGSCEEGLPAYSPLNGGCLYLISTGKSEFPSLFADASTSGGDVFFFTREALVGQDKDELQDVYDARVGGGLPSQNPVATEPCPSPESCHGPVQEPPIESAPATSTFVGPGNPVPKHKKQKAKKHKKKHKKHKGKNAKAKAKNKGRNAR